MINKARGRSPPNDPKGSVNSQYPNQQGNEPPVDLGDSTCMDPIWDMNHGSTTLPKNDLYISRRFMALYSMMTERYI